MPSITITRSAPPSKMVGSCGTDSVDTPTRFSGNVCKSPEPIATNCIAGLIAMAAPISIALGNVIRRIQIRRRICRTTRLLKPSSAIGADSKMESSQRSSASLILSTMLIIFDVKSGPDLFFAPMNNRLDRADRLAHRCADFPMRQSASI